MSLPVVYLRAARWEFDEAFDWYDRQRPGRGERFAEAVQAIIDRIAEDPERHAVVHQGARKVIVPGYPYSVFYQVDADRLVVLSVFHAKRDPQIWRSRIQ